VKDLAAATVHCLTHPVARCNTYFVANSEVITARQMAEEVADQSGTWGVPLPLPNSVLWPLCLFSECWSRFSGKASVLSLQKYQEVKAPGWVCDSGKLTRDTGYECKTGLSEGITQTLKWYREYGWLEA
jgi:nucleoside-diphosphate-sugar epimerase